MKIRVLFMGSPEIAVPSLQALVDAGYEVPLVITQPDRPKGRGRSPSPPPVKVAATELGLPVIQPTRIKTPEFLRQIQESQAQAIAVVAYGRLLPKEVLSATPWGAINVHFSLLPKYRGASCVAQALMAGEEETGTTTMLIDEGMDTGPILMQWTEPILPEDTTASLSARLAPLGAQQLVMTLQALEAGNLRPVPQEEAGASYAPPLKKEQGHLDWNQEVKTLYHLYQGLTPWPGIFGFIDGKRLLLTRLQAAAGPVQGNPGTFYRDPQGDLYINGRDGLLQVLQVKPEGKAEMSAEAWVRGRGEVSGCRLE